MTPTTWGIVLTAFVFVGGLIFFMRWTDGRIQLIGLAATVVLTFVIGWLAWFAWLMGTIPAGS